jgi:hypothetical protein
MKIDFIKNIIKQVVCWILLLQIINISINPPDAKHAKYSSITDKEDLLINETESIYELIAEGLFNEDVPESNEDDIDTSSPSVELYFSTGIFSTLPAIEFPFDHFAHCNNNFPSLHHEPLFQPPKQA